MLFGYVQQLKRETELIESKSILCPSKLRVADADKYFPTPTNAIKALLTSVTFGTRLLKKPAKRRAPPLWFAQM